MRAAPFLPWLVALGSLATAPGPGAAQWSSVYDQFYLQDRSNWVFRKYYPAADRLFNAFDYGHAILYETLWTRPDAPAAVLEDGQFDFLTRELLLRPPRVPLEERAIEPTYARLAPEAKAMFDWAHLLHRQTYDVLADERLTEAGKDAKVAALLRYYRSRPDLAFSVMPKSMGLMEGRPYSLAFRKRYPKFNGLIWAYHWLQVGLYEPLLTGRTVLERQLGVTAAVARFRQMMLEPPRGFPSVMPMTPAIAPTLAARFPELAVIFDNLHSMHDVISDILANAAVPRNRKRAEILRAAAAYRDDTTELITRAEWLEMAAMMGLAAQGGPVNALLSPALQAPVLDEHAVHRAAPPVADTAFARLQDRGKAVMGVDQYTSRHVFEDLPDGGRIVLVRDTADMAGTRTIRQHLQAIVEAFGRGDFALPGQVHDREVPGTRTMAAQRAAIHYMFEERPGGGAVRIHATTPEAVRAVHEFLEFQRRDHRTPSPG